LPDLSGHGFQPVGARLLSNEVGPAALLVFEDGQGQRISSFLRSPGERFERMPSGQRTDGGLEARYWSHGDYNFALVSAVDDSRGGVAAGFESEFVSWLLVFGCWVLGVGFESCMRIHL
jgi:anti-sigma factor RsiW